jgi:hypothetical protein
MPPVLICARRAECWILLERLEVMMGAGSKVSNQLPSAPAFHAFGWSQQTPDRKAAIAGLHQDCEDFDDIVGNVVIIDGVRYICFTVHAFDLLPPYREGQLVELVVTEF